MSVVFMASLPLPSAPWHPAHLALNAASPAAVSAFAGALSRHVPVKITTTSVTVRSWFIFVFMWLLLPDEFFNSMENFCRIAAVQDRESRQKCDCSCDIRNNPKASFRPANCEPAGPPAVGSQGN